MQRPPKPSRIAAPTALGWRRLARLGLWASLLGVPFFASTAAAQSAATVDRAAAIRLSASLLRIEAHRLTGGFSLGSGVLVAPGLVVTNCHVTRQADTLHVVRGGVRWQVTAQRADIAHDLCLLRAPGVQAAVAPLADADALMIGQDVTALGYTGGIDLQHSFGTVVDLHRFDDGQVIRTSNGFNSGASGGGLFDAEGRLAGILTFRLRGAEQHYFAAPARWVRQLLLAASDSGLPALAPLEQVSLPFWQIQGDRQPRFLRAALLVREQRWDDLATLAQRWLRDDGQDGEPWYLLGTALHRLDQPAAALQAFDCALRLQPQRLAALPAQPVLRLPSINPAGAHTGAGAMTETSANSLNSTLATRSSPCAPAA